MGQFCVQFNRHDWYDEAVAQFQNSDLHAAHQKISVLFESCTQTGASTYLEWLKYMLAGNGATGRPRALSTIKSMFVSATPRLLGMIGVDDPKSWESEELFEIYRELAAEDGADRPSMLSRALREFHYFLHKTGKLPPLVNVEEVLGEEAGLAPVDANLISPDDYQKAMDWLDAQRLIGVDGDHIATCRIVLMMAFRLGMRRMEIMGLRLKDLHMRLGMDCLIRPHAGRRLKTSNSRRRLPMSILFNWRERKELRRWYERRLAEEKEEPFSEYFLALPKAKQVQAPVESITDRIQKALHAVTGDTRLHLHHCRHAFGTWLYLKLRAPDYPEVAASFAHLPMTCHELMNGRRLRIALLGIHEAPSRSYAFVVARLLGHSSPAVSMSHYLHANDLILYAITCRSARQLSKRELAAVAGIGEDQGYKLLSSGVESLLEWTREYHAENFDILPPVAPECAPVRGRPKKPIGTESEEWLASDRVWPILHLAANAQKTTAEIAQELGFEEGQVTLALEMGKQLGPKIVSGHDPEKIFCPVKPRILAEIDWGRQLEHRIARLSQRDSVLCKQGLDIFLQNYNRQRKDVVFTYPRQIKHAKLFLRFIRKMGFQHSDLSFVLRGDEISETDWVHWQEELEGLVEYEPLLIGRPSKEKTAYLHWLGIKLLGPDKTAWPSVTASTVLLARISIELMRPEG